MNASEVRIGNLCKYHVRDSIEGDSFVINTIDYEDIRILFGNEDEDYIPIPLTEEWLLKFGFEKTDINSGVIKQYFHDCTPPKYRNDYGLFFRFGEMRDEEYKMYWYASSAISSSMHSFPCKYVHQLQNLYFALTGEELKLK